ncbi:MAG: hypothetical protein HY675_01755 [Chloroflexi bacterium]|nr:hypothetical protein [Chloroflexota bacterium]
MMSKLKGYVLLGTALIACPCHLPITLALLAGTSLGGFLSDNQALVIIGLSGYFILALFLSFRILAPSEARATGPTDRGRDNGALHCETCVDVSLRDPAKRNDRSSTRSTPGAERSRS